MIFNPFKAHRRHERLQREALEEAQLLRRRHGDDAITAARETLRRPDLTTWGHRVMERAISLLEHGKA